MSQKRNRSINWDEEEKQLLRFVLKEYSQIIENKSLDTNTNKSKTKAWEDVLKKFNQLNSRPRELSQLKIQWKTMKVNARKTYSTFNKEVNKTGGGARPTSPNDAIIEITDLLNPAELLRDHNIYDSDGIKIGEIEFPPNAACPIKLQDSKTTNQLTALNTLSVDNNTEIENQQLTNTGTETIEDVDAEVAVQEFMPLVISEDELIMATPMKKSVGIIPAKKVPKRKIMSHNNISNGSKFRKDQEDYVNSMLRHSKMLKDEEHMRRMEMAEEEHAIKIEIEKEKLRSAVLEREILELRKKKEESLFVI